MNPQCRQRFAVVIPVYNHAATVADVVRRAAALGWPVFVVDDGATDGSGDRAAGIPGARVLRHPHNRGKGAALMAGFAAASAVADWAVTLDADGQHDPADAAILTAAIPAGARPIVVGHRRGMTGAAVPWTSRFGRGFSNFWVRVSGGPDGIDTQCGFRVYPLPEVMKLGTVARRYQFEVEILIRARRAGMGVISAPIGVTYLPGAGRVSHFRPFVDFCRNTGMFTRMIFSRVMGGA